ncbi:hypothetical protein EJ08DRAFT_477472 [Tothia fuscella]|uniref:Transposase n=1 Tax=Tothia fuscella TaxID=1048955 RepID=A0A9P4NI82_9PEZI|nr:hypothetical protein EJ08DRAFT_477472 [Tothia fuscella]
MGRQQRVPKTKRVEYDTPRRLRFFDAFDNKQKGQGVGVIAKMRGIDVVPSTARYWLKQRGKLGANTIRRTRKSSSTLGRKSKVFTADLRWLTDQADPIHEDTDIRSLLFRSNTLPQ